MIDWARVSELRDEVGAEDFEEVVQLFLAEVEDVVGRLQAGSDRDALEADLHYLRGSALSLGFASFSRLCLEVEQKAGRGLATDEEISEVLFAFFNSKADFIDGLPAALAA
ncbi:Hpt domain-containing protein [Marinibacterium sp. SX1]|uniref:Hpt domain-containing protein n=1 Tax=Marinibacterium sp. SX1 TaxID=3388424 RepID=UPI003D16A844